MKTNGQFEKDAMTTDQKFRTDDEHLHEVDKRHLKEAKKDAGSIPQSGKKAPEKGKAS